MSEKLRLQWNDFKANVNSAFGKLRSDEQFTDVTLACGDGDQIEAHKVILAASSPFFEKILLNNKHPHPLIYLKGFQSKNLVAIIDFLYFGEANVHKEDLDCFLAIAEELKLKGLTGQTSSDVLEGQGNPKNFKSDIESKESFIFTHGHGADLGPNVNALQKSSSALAIPNQFSDDLQELDEKVKSLMEKTENKIPNGQRNKNGTPMLRSSFICKLCGKEGVSHHIRDHIEANHLEGIALPCEHCDKVFSARINLNQHKNRVHK